MRCAWLTWLILAAPSISVAQDVAAAADRLEFFERRIRPVLVEHCYSCHSAQAEKLQGGLRLDSGDAVLRGGESGPALAVGDPQGSLLVSALRYESFEMPPRGKLPETVIADFEKWIEDGAFDPRLESAAPVAAATIDIDAGRAHWAFQPIGRPLIPDVDDLLWPRSDIDLFLLKSLEAKGLHPAEDVEAELLARRLSFDLIGLPPSSWQIQALIEDPSPRGLEQVVDELLASPRFGERWGRHWLDVVRFGESLTLRGFVFENAWRYRDYVIEAFNQDLSYDQFVIEQLAGDLLPVDDVDLAQMRRRRIATTFLMLGNTNLEDQDKRKLEMDFIDEQLDVIGKGLMAQTITCARCHDHKFDPIPTSDYYALAGILANVQALEHANVSKWIEVSLPLAPELEASLKQAEQSILSVERQLKKVNDELAALSKSPSVVSPSQLPGVVVDDAAARRVGQWTTSTSVKPYVGEGYLHDGDREKGGKTLTFLPNLPADGVYEVRLAYTAGPNRSASVPVTVFSGDGEKTLIVNQTQPPPLDDLWISLGHFRFEVQGQSFVIVSTENTNGHVIADAVQFLSESEGADAADAADAAMEAVELASRADQARGQLEKESTELDRQLRTLRKSAPARPKAMSVVEKQPIEELRVHVRGSVHNLGGIAPRGVLQVATIGVPPTLDRLQSGRLELARWLASSDHPLASRVIVNRVWHWIFGQGLVRTVDNFGLTGEQPSHRELLDYLAADFVRHNWSIKHLVRKIITSRAYRLSTEGNAALLAADPENRLFGRAIRKRLDAESLRDAMLWSSGGLNLEVGGRTFPQELASDYGFQYAGTRRSVYAPVFRNSLPPLLEAFDFADPSMVTGRRNVSTVAPQALILMNHPFVVEQATRLARRLMDQEPRDGRRRARLAFELTLSRPPTDAEGKLSSEFLGDALASSDDSDLDAWVMFCQSLLSSIDFRYLR